MYLGFVAAALLTLTYYPGAFYYDVIRQFNWVESISDSLRHGAVELPHDFISWWPIWNTFFRVPFYILTNEPGFILFISIIFFFWSARELCRSLHGEHAWLVFIFLCTFTPVAAWVVLHGPHTILAACLFLAISRYLAGRYFSASLFAAAGVLFRPEAVLIALVLPGGLALGGKLKLWKALVAGLIAVLGFSISTWKYPDPAADQNSAEGLSLLTLAVLSQEPSALAEDKTLSSFFKRVPPYDLQCSLSVWCPPMSESTDYAALHRPGSLGALIKANLRLATREPGLYLGTVMKRILLASLQRLRVAELGRTDSVHLANAPVIRNYMTPNMANLVQRHQIFYVSPFGAFYTPVVFILVMVVVGGLALRRLDISLIILGCAMTYFPKTIILPTQEIRYYFFELMFSLLIALISVDTIATRLGRYLFQK